MQNKPNFRKAQINVNVFPTKDYENQLVSKLQKNKPNQSQFQTGRHALVAENKQ